VVLEENFLCLGKGGFGEIFIEVALLGGIPGFVVFAVFIFPIAATGIDPILGLGVVESKSESGGADGFGARGGPVTLSGISKRQSISLSYLEQLFGKLRRHALVESVRGPGGGYCLARTTENLSVADIIRAVDEPLDATQCGGKENCHEETRCMTHELWARLNTKMYEYLSSVKLSDLVAEQKALGRPTDPKITVLQDKRPRPAVVSA